MILLIVGAFPVAYLTLSQKKSLHGTGWCFQCREVWELSTRVQSSDLMASCQFNRRRFGGGRLGADMRGRVIV
jgi:hypothetical protein